MAGTGYALEMGDERMNSVRYAAERQGISTADYIRLAVDRMLAQSNSVLMVTGHITSTTTAAAPLTTHTYSTIVGTGGATATTGAETTTTNPTYTTVDYGPLFNQKSKPYEWDDHGRE